MSYLFQCKNWGAGAREKRGGRLEKRGREAGFARLQEPGQFEKFEKENRNISLYFGNGTKRKEPLRKRGGGWGGGG